jgi:DNA polymerase III sliding clamp (beta) subunit (PCNA family)
MPVLGAVTITRNFEGTNLSATNLDQWMLIRLQDQNKDTPVFPLSVSSLDLYNTLRFVDDEEVVIKITNDSAIVSSGSSTHRMPLIADPLPIFPEAEWEDPFLIEKLPELLARCLPFSSTDSNRYILNGVYFSGIGLVAASNYGFIKVKTEIKGEANVPPEAVKLIAKEDGDVTVRFSSSLAEFKGEDWTLTTKLIEGVDGSKFMNLQPLLHIKILHRLECNRVEAIKAAAFAALPLPQLIDVIAVEASDTTAKFFTPHSYPNPRERTIEATADKPHSWAVSARKLATALGAFDCEMVDIGFTDTQTMIVEDGNTMVLLMLCRI